MLFFPLNWFYQSDPCPGPLFLCVLALYTFEPCLCLKWRLISSSSFPCSASISQKPKTFCLGLLLIVSSPSNVAEMWEALAYFWCWVDETSRENKVYNCSCLCHTLAQSVRCLVVWITENYLALGGGIWGTYSPLVYDISETCRNRYFSFGVSSVPLLHKSPWLMA